MLMRLSLNTNIQDWLTSLQTFFENFLRIKLFSVKIDRLVGIENE